MWTVHGLVNIIWAVTVSTYDGFEISLMSFSWFGANGSFLWEFYFNMQYLIILKAFHFEYIQTDTLRDIVQCNNKSGAIKCGYKQVSCLFHFKKNGPWAPWLMCDQHIRLYAIYNRWVFIANNFWSRAWPLSIDCKVSYISAHAAKQIGENWHFWPYLDLIWQDDVWPGAWPLTCKWHLHVTITIDCMLH